MKLTTLESKDARQVKKVVSNSPRLPEGSFFAIKECEITLLRSLDRGNSWQDILPYKISTANAYLDKSDRLYLGTSGAIWDKNMGSFVSDDPEFPAYIYYTTK